MSIDVPQRWSSSAYAAMILSRLKQKIAANRSGSLLKSVARRQKFIRLALKFTPLLRYLGDVVNGDDFLAHENSQSIALFLVGLVWLLLLPYEGYNKRTYISENALLPAQVPRVLSISSSFVRFLNAGRIGQRILWLRRYTDS